MKIKTVTYVLCILLLIFQIACRTDSNIKKPDVSNIELDFNLLRTENIFFNVDSTTLRTKLFQFAHHQSSIAELYFEKLLQAGRLEDNDYLASTQLFFANKNINALNDSVQLIIQDFEAPLAEVEMAYKYFKYHFPNHQLPEPFTAITEFGPAAFTLDTINVGISLDMYLGPDFVYYPGLGFPQYQIRNFKPEFLPANTMKAIYNAKFPFKKDPYTLLDQMIYNGKILYLLDLTLSNNSDHLKINYSPEQIDWAKANVGRIYAFFIEKELLYETKSSKFNKYISEGPTSSGMPIESPGNIGSWLGWKIVRAFMANNPDVTVDRLMQINEGQLILAKSRFKPKTGFFQ